MQFMLDTAVSRGVISEDASIEAKRKMTTYKEYVDKYEQAVSVGKMALAQREQPVLPNGMRLVEVTVNGTKGRISVNKKIDEIFDAAAKYGIDIAMAGGTARKMVFCADPTHESSDIDIVVMGYTRAARPSNISEFVKELAGKGIFVEILNVNDQHSISPRIFSQPYFKMQYSRVSTLSKLIITRKSAGKFGISDEKGGEYLYDVQKRRLRLSPENARADVDAKLQFVGALRYMREMLEDRKSVV